MIRKLKEEKVLENNLIKLSLALFIGLICSMSDHTRGYSTYYYPLYSNADR